MSEIERTEILKHCKWVDEVICPCPWVITIDFLRKNNIHYVAHDEMPYSSAGSGDIYDEVKKLVSSEFIILTFLGHVPCNLAH